MRPIASIIGLRRESERQYRALHKNVFPGVLARISRSNIRNYSIFLRDGDPPLFAIVLFGSSALCRRVRRERKETA